MRSKIKGHGPFDACRRRKALLQSSSLNCRYSDSVLHHVAGVSLLLVEGHILLMNLLLVVMAVDDPGLHYNGVMGAR